MSEQPQNEIDSTLMRSYLESRAEDQRQLGQLEGATTRLADEISGLRETMSTYRAEIERMRTSTVTKADAIVAKEQMLENLVQIRLRIKKRANRLFATAMVTLLAAVGVGAYVLHDEAVARRDACVTRDNGARAALPFYDRQIANLRAHHSDPAVIGVLQVARVTAQHSIVKC